MAEPKSICVSRPPPRHQFYSQCGVVDGAVVHAQVGEQHVLGLDVAMDHAEAVQAAQREERFVDDGFEEAWVVAQRRQNFCE